MLNTVLTPTPIPVPPRPKPGPIGTWEELAQHQLRLQVMVFMLCKSMSYRAIARELGVARTTVMRMAPEAASFSAYTDCFINIPLPATRFETSETGARRRQQQCRGQQQRRGMSTDLADHELPIALVLPSHAPTLTAV